MRRRLCLFIGSTHELDQFAYLTQFFRDIERATFSRASRLRVIKGDIVSDVINLADFRHFDSDVKAQRDHYLEDDDKRPEGQHALVVCVLENRDKRDEGELGELGKPEPATGRADHA